MPAASVAASPSQRGHDDSKMQDDPATAAESKDEPMADEPSAAAVEKRVVPPEEALRFHAKALDAYLNVFADVQRHQSRRAGRNALSLSTECVMLLRVLLSCAQWQPFVSAVVAAAVNSVSQALRGDLLVWDEAAHTQVAVGTTGDALTDVALSLGYHAPSFASVRQLAACARVGPLQALFARGLAAMAVLGGHVDRVRLGGLVRRMDAQPWSLGADDSGSSSQPSQPRPKTLAQMLPRPTDYDASVAGVSTAHLVASRLVDWPVDNAAVAEQLHAHASGTGVFATGPGVGYADEIGVDVPADLAPWGSDCGVLVAMSGPDSGRRSARPDAQLELAVRGVVGSAFVVTMNPDDVVPAEELPSDPVAASPQVRQQLLTDTLVTLLCPVMDEELCDEDALVSSDPRGDDGASELEHAAAPAPDVSAAAAAPRDTTIANLSARAIVVPLHPPKPPAVLGSASSRLAPQQLPPVDDLADVVPDLRVGRAVLRVHALKAAAAMLSTTDAMQAFVDAAAAGAEAAGDGGSRSNAEWLLVHIMRRACCVTATAGLCDTEDVEAAWISVLHAWSVCESAAVWRDSVAASAAVDGVTSSLKGGEDGDCGGDGASATEARLASVKDCLKDGPLLARAAEAAADRLRKRLSRARRTDGASPVDARCGSGASAGREDQRGASAGLVDRQGDDTSAALSFGGSPSRWDTRSSPYSQRARSRDGLMIDAQLDGVEVGDARDSDRARPRDVERESGHDHGMQHEHDHEHEHEHEHEHDQESDEEDEIDIDEAHDGDDHRVGHVLLDSMFGDHGEGDGGDEDEDDIHTEDGEGDDGDGDGGSDGGGDGGGDGVRRRRSMSDSGAAAAAAAAAAASAGGAVDMFRAGMALAEAAAAAAAPAAAGAAAAAAAAATASVRVVCCVSVCLCLVCRVSCVLSCDVCLVCRRERGSTSGSDCRLVC
jgi:hypothetical protein